MKNIYEENEHFVFLLIN